MKSFNLAHLSIRTKLTLPYVLLSMIIALGGGIIVTRVVIDSLEDRFTNQLIETRKLASELMVREENRLLETLRLISHIEGIPTAIHGGDKTRIFDLVYPITFNAGEDVVLILDQHGVVLASILRSEDTGKYQFIQITEKLDTLPFVAKLIDQQVDDKGDKYAGVSNADWGNYFFVSGPVKTEDGQYVGAVLVGTSLKKFVQKIREETLSQATIYDSEFHPIASTFTELPGSPNLRPETIFKTKEVQSVTRDLNINSLAYTEVLGAWEIRGGEDIGFLGTALPKSFVVRTSQITRLNVTLQIILAITATIYLGVFLSGLITRPILNLKSAAFEISKGNLDVQVHAEGTDEVAVLAKSFNEMVSNLRRSEKNLVQAYDKTLEGWVKALELRDQETLGHTLRAADMTLKLAHLMKVDEAKMENIRRGVLLHDIGKMAIPDRILLKRGPLLDWERKIIEKHPDLAREMLSEIEFLRPCMDIPYCHHEKWNGGGYPQGLVGKQIPIAARIFAVVDVWDALISERPYRNAWPEENALRYIKEQSGKYFDPEVVETFIQLIQNHLGKNKDQEISSKVFSPTGWPMD